MNRYLPLWIGALTFVLGCQPSSDTPTKNSNFGRFEGTIVASWDEDGRHMTLREPFTYIDAENRTWFAPAGTTVDGASIPSAFWTLIGGPFEGKYRAASVVHDVGCVEMKQSWEDVHWMFYEACRCAGVSESEAKMLYYAVYHFGPRWQPVTENVVVAEQTEPTTGPSFAPQSIEKEVTVNHMVRTDPLPPTAAEIEQVQSFVMEENPSMKELQQLTRESLHRRPRRGGGYKRPGENSNRPTPENSQAQEQPEQANPQLVTLPYQNRPQFSPEDRRNNWGNRSGEQSFNRQNYSGHRSGMPTPELTSEEQQWAAGIVRQYIDQQSDEPRQANYTARRSRGGYRVLVQFLETDATGQLVPTAGGEYSVRLSREGQIMEMVSGAESISRTQEANRQELNVVR